jgi:FkbM family methyltransferase
LDLWKALTVETTRYRATPQARKKATLRYTRSMLETYSTVRQVLASSGEIAEKALRKEDRFQVMTRAGRLFASGMPVIGGYLLQKNSLGIRPEVINRTALEKNISSWVNQLSMPAPLLIEKLASPIIDRLYPPEDSSPKLRFEHSIGDDININENAACFQWLTAAKTDGFVIDVGAHFGNTARPYLEKGWGVLAFEPDSAKMRALNALKAAHPRLIVDTRAVSDRVGSAAFHTAQEKHGIASLLAFHSDHEQSHVAETTTLAAAMQQHGVEYCDLLKIDIEGYELPALKSFPWHRCQPALILSEFDDFKTRMLGYGVSDQVSFLESMGYDVFVSEWFPIVEYGTQHRFKAFYPSSELTTLEARSWGNLLAFKNGTFDENFPAILKRHIRKNKR